MIQAIAFDLDGVLVDACPLHRKAFRYALVDVMSRQLTAEEEVTLEGRPTTVKCALLGLTAAETAAVNARKQELTFQLIESEIHPDPAKVAMLAGLRRRGYVIGCVSNSLHKTVDEMLGFAELFGVDIIIGADDVPNPKPAPDGYLHFMSLLGLQPTEILIVEDSDVGFQAALASGGNVLRVTDYTEVTLGAVLHRTEKERCNY